jgi:peroxin-12
MDSTFFFSPNTGASISETFYGLSRYNLKKQSFGKRDFVASFAFLVIIPYLLRKLENRMKIVKERLQDEISTEDKYKVLGLYSYRMAKSTYEFTQIIKYITYLSNRADTHNIPLFLSGIGLKYANPLEVTFSFMDIVKGNVKISTVLGTIILRTLEFGGFFLQFVQWYQNSSASQKITAQLPIPEPPKLDANASKLSGICPICYQTFAIPTALSVSGYTFCYKCITKHLNKRQYCPVTYLPASIDDLVRIYDN